jgi:phosphodiesterase/alkaline phosphatase D-like protein
MTRNNAGNTLIAVIIIIILLLGGVYFWMTSTPDLALPPVPDDTAPSQTQSGLPMASTKETSFVSQTSVALNGEVNPNGAQTSYWYEYGTTSSLGSFTNAQLVGAGNIVYGAPGVLTGLSSNTLYYYKLTAQNQNGQTSGAVASFRTTATPPSTPAPSFTRPSAQTRDATGITSGNATLNGTVNPNGAATIYWFEYGKTSGLGSTTTSATLGPVNSSLAATNSLFGLEANTVYYYRLNAQNAYGTANGHISVFRTQPGTPPASPPSGQAPTAVTSDATNVGRTSATLNGQVDPNGSASTYHFVYGKATPFGAFILSQTTDSKTGGSGTGSVPASFALTGLDPDSTYYYQLVVENQHGTDLGAIFNLTTEE